MINGPAEYHEEEPIASKSPGSEIFVDSKASRIYQKKCLIELNCFVEFSGIN